ncbi:MAG TPA: hypothetical protein VGD56_14245 [Gemmatirosa sp.]
MRTRTFFSLVSLAATSALATSTAAAQPGAFPLICRDGARIVARDGRACAFHGGVDGRATQAFRDAVIRRETLSRDNRVFDGGYRDPRDAYESDRARWERDRQYQERAREEQYRAEQYREERYRAEQYRDQRDRDQHPRDEHFRDAHDRGRDGSAASRRW